MSRLKFFSYTLLSEGLSSPTKNEMKISNSSYRFAEFVEGDSWHVSNEEMLEYDSGPDPEASHLITDDEDEDEIDFLLNSP